MPYPLTSIIILTKNNIQFTERCIFSIYEHLDKTLTPYEIIILDENSIDGTKEFCELHRLHYENVPQLNTFSKRNNYGASIAKGNFLWFLNNDTELVNENLSKMLKHFVNPKIGAVGNKHVFPDGTLNHIGIAIDHNLEPVHIFPNENPKLQYINHGRYIDLLTSASIIFRKDIFKEIGGYSEDYTWGYEDIDIMLKLKEAGYKAYCDNEATIIHFGQSTYGRTENDDKNREIFKEKWRSKLKPNVDEIYKEKEHYLERSKYKKFPQKAIKSTVNKTLSLISKSHKLNNSISVPYSKIYVFKSPNFSAFRKVADDLANVIDEKYVEIDSIDSLYNLDNQGKESMLISTTHFYPEYLIPAPEWVRDFRTFDVNYERTDYSNPDYWVESLKNNKMIILASSNYCRDFLIKSGLNERRVFVVHHGFKKEILKYDFEEKENDRIKLSKKVNALVIINTNDEARYGTEYLAQACQLLREQSPETADRLKLIIKNYGGATTEVFFKTKEYLEILKAGVEIEYISKFLTDDELANLYYKVDLFIAPFRGEGFGMKIVDAAAAGLPIIAPFYGGPKDYLQFSEHLPVKYKLIPVTNGIDRFSLLLDETYVWAEVDSEDLAQQIKYAIENIHDLKGNAIKKRDKIRREFSYEEKWKKIKEINNKLDKNSLSSGKKFEFYDSKLIYDKATSTQKALKSIEQTLIINTIRIENVRETFEHIDKYLNINNLKGEILVVDDASNSEPDQLLKDYDHFPLRYIKYKDWGGSGFAREIGLRYAKGDNIIIIGDDIKPMPGFFEGHYDFYKSHKEPYTLIGHVEWDAKIRNEPVAEFTTKYSEFQFGFEVVRNSTKVDYTKVVTPNISFRKSDILALEQHFKIGFILHEDTIWGKELEVKGVQHYYSRKIYALHNHKLKENTEWIDWFIIRSFAIGNNLQAYALNPEEFDDFMHIKNALILIQQIYSSNNKENLIVFSKFYDTYHGNLVEQYSQLRMIDQSDGYKKQARLMIYNILGDLFVLNWVYGLVKAINPNLSNEISKGIAFAYFTSERENLYNKFKDNYHESIGMMETLRMFVSRGRKRYPMVFEPVFKVMKSIKNL